MASETVREPAKARWKSLIGKSQTMIFFMISGVLKFAEREAVIYRICLKAFSPSRHSGHFLAGSLVSNNPQSLQT